MSKHNLHTHVKSANFPHAFRTPPSNWADEVIKIFATTKQRAIIIIWRFFSHDSFFGLGCCEKNTRITSRFVSVNPQVRFKESRVLRSQPEAIKYICISNSKFFRRRRSEVKKLNGKCKRIFRPLCNYQSRMNF